MIGVIADDITGANDAGGMFAKAGYLTHVYLYPAAGGLEIRGRKPPDVLVLDTESRYDPAAEAYGKVLAATRLLRDAACARFYKKICSVFRGNIGAEMDALLDALGEEFAVVVVGFPKTGRLTVGGIHYVHGQKLEDSAFRHDPVHPMDRSNLVEILRDQTHRPVVHIHDMEIRRGPEVLKRRIDELRPHTGYAILDVVDQTSLAAIAVAARNERVVVGSSGLAEELAKLWCDAPSVAPLAGNYLQAELGVLCVAGSLTPQAVAQIAHLQTIGVVVVDLDPTQVFDAPERAAEIERVAASCARVLIQGGDVALRAPAHPALLKQTQDGGAARGFSRAATARLVSDTLGRAVAAVAQCTGLARLIVAGGDTAAAICSSLGIRGMRILEEIEPGVPSCITFSDPPMYLVLKPGGYGESDFFARAIDHLRRQRG